MEPGPHDAELLYDQDVHRSTVVWEEGYASNNVLFCRRLENSVKKVPRDPRMDVYLRQAGFYGVAKLPFIQLDWALITAFVERWRSETHTFHMVGGEMTITLQDVQIQLGLPIEGDPVIGSTGTHFADVCRNLLGEVPGRNDMRAGRVKLSWLSAHFDHIPAWATDEQVRMHTRAYILQLIGAMLFPDKSDSLVHLMWLPLLEDLERAGHYSWGSACLAWLYRNLCRASHRDSSQAAGCLILLQIWAWDRFPHISPRRRRSRLVDGMPLAYRWGVEFDTRTASMHVLSVYREALDRQSDEQVTKLDWLFA